MKLFSSLVFVCSGLAASGSWEVTGTIDAVDGEAMQITVSHEGIPGFVEESGKLDVQVSSGDWAIAEVGRRIKGQLSEEEEHYVLSGIWPGDEDVHKTMTLINRDLMRPRIGEPRNRILQVGDKIPRFALYNQRAELITPDDWEDKLVVLNFIFTRSRVPSMCRAATTRLVELQARLRDEGFGDSVIFMSLSLDSEYDTPGISHAFMDEMGVDHSTFWLLSGSQKTLEFVRKKIGVVTSPSEKTIINHSMVTLIADREGRIFYRRPGSRWKVEDLYDRLEILLTTR